MNQKAPLTVTQINELLRMTIDSNRLFASVSIIGEISNLKVHFASGHIYFSLKDEDSVLKCVMFRPSAAKLSFAPESGMKVIVKGRISVFTRDGQYQLYAEEMEPDGIGGKYLAFEQLKKKLESEGLFDDTKKRPLPTMPKTIGVITSASGAAFQDILNVLKRRYPIGQVVLYPASVQGIEAPASLLAAIKWFSANRNVADVLIIGRGGGSFEDLNAFNDEALCRAIASCPIPVISAVGHETDYTICDFVSDRRAPTPSAAAELSAPDISVLLDTVAAMQSRMHLAIDTKIQRLGERVRICSESRMLSSPMEAVLEKEKRLAQLNDRFTLARQRLIADKSAVLSALTAKLEALSPLAVLARGYAAVFDENEQVITRSDQVKVDDDISLRFGDGIVMTKVTNITKKEEIHNG